MLALQNNNLNEIQMVHKTTLNAWKVHFIKLLVKVLNDIRVLATGYFYNDTFFDEE